MKKGFYKKFWLPVLTAMFAVSCFISGANAGFEWHPPAQLEPEATNQEPLIPESEGPLSPMPFPTAPMESEFLAPELMQAPALPKTTTTDPVTSIMAPPAPTARVLEAPGELLYEPPVEPAVKIREEKPEQVYYQGEPLRRKKPEMPMPLSPSGQDTAHLLAPPAPVMKVPAEVSKNQPAAIDLYPMENAEPAVPETQYIPETPAAPTEKAGEAFTVELLDTPTPSESKEDLPYYSEAIGFGKNMPLALALAQIVPPDYPYVFANGVDPGVKIDWQGGKAWNEVLSEAVKPYGYEVLVTGNGVIIRLRNQKRTDAKVSDNPAPRFASEETPEPVFPQETAGLMPIPLAAPEQTSSPLTAKTDTFAPAEQAQAIAPLEREEVPLVPERSMIEMQPPAPPQPKDPWEVAMDNNNTPDPDKPAEYYDYIAVRPGITPAAFSSENSSPKFDQYAVKVWTAQTGDTLQNSLINWSKQAGVQLHWASKFDYPLQSDVVVQGTFEEAVEVLLTGLMEANPRPIGRLHPNNPEGPAILIVETRHVID